MTELPAWSNLPVEPSAFEYVPVPAEEAALMPQPPGVAE